MHAALGAYRAEHAAELGRLDAERERARRLLASAELARDRTWAFPFHSDEALRGLADEIAARFAPL